MILLLVNFPDSLRAILLRIMILVLFVYILIKTDLILPIITPFDLIKVIALLLLLIFVLNLYNVLILLNFFYKKDRPDTDTVRVKCSFFCTKTRQCTGKYAECSLVIKLRVPHLPFRWVLCGTFSLDHIFTAFLCLPCQNTSPPVVFS